MTTQSWGKLNPRKRNYSPIYLAIIAILLFLLAYTVAYDNLVVWTVPYPDTPAGTCAAWGTSDNVTLCWFPAAETANR